MSSGGALATSFINEPILRRFLLLQTQFISKSVIFLVILTSLIFLINNFENKNDKRLGIKMKHGKPLISRL